MYTKTIVSEMDEDCAYARLVGRAGDVDNYQFISFDIKNLPVSLGRSADICLDKNDSTLSRTHASIDWDATQASFVIKVLSKNGLVVHKKLYPQGSVVRIENGSAIRLGKSRVYIVLPRLESLRDAIEA